MTSFNIESEFLDLKKTYQNFEYENLVAEGIVEIQQALGEDPDRFIGITQNTYLFCVQKNTLIKDTENLSLYFMHKYVEELPQMKVQAFKKFPFEKVRDRVCFIFQKYQQQPTLLDSLLEQLIQPIMQAAKRYFWLLLKQNYKIREKQNHEIHSLFQIVYQLIKVRGKKYIMQYFPHQVKDLYPVIGYLVEYRHDHSKVWESHYVLLLWLGVIALVPFDLQIIDSGVVRLPRENGNGQAQQIVDLMLEIGKYYLRSLTKLREASSMFLSKLFTRPDIQKRGVLKEYITFSLNKLVELRNNPMENFFTCGLIYCLAHIFKRVQRNQMLSLINPVIQYLKEERETVKDNATKKQYKMKLLTHIGLTYLKPRVATWAYKKQKRSLLTNLSKNMKMATIQTNTAAFQNSMNSGNGENEINQENDLEYYRDVNKLNLEEIIDMLVDGLCEKETLVRQKSSKGLGKIAGRLSQDMVLDILDYITSLTPSPQTAHAVCLTIAEFIRRNLISPSKLIELYQLMKDSLLYEIEQGGYSIGQAVRDAACYMTWSVARGYEQGGYDLGIILMIAACFDREVGCRRAASAAYQELVGRVGDVPNGIQILTEADYFTLGLQKNAYLNVAVFVASYEPYFKPFVQHLGYQKLRHWDLEVKRIAACSLSLMCPLNPNFIAKELLPALAKYLNHDNLGVKLGSIIGIGEILLGLKGKCQNHQLQNQMKDSVFLKSLTQNEKKLLKAGEYMTQFRKKYNAIETLDNFVLIDPETIEEIIGNIIHKIKEGKIYKGKSGENFRIYTCRLLLCFALCKVPLTSDQIKLFHDFIEQNIKNPLQPIIQASVKCLKPFLSQYHNVAQDQLLIKNIMNAAKASSKTLSIISKGYTLALSKFNKEIYLHHFDEIISTLEYNCRITKENDDPEKRKYSLLGLEALIKEIGFEDGFITAPIIQRIFNIFFTAMNDYTMDKRGDIGSIVREAAMSGLIQIIKKYESDKNRKTEISSSLIEKMVGMFLQQLSQKIDRIRLLSGSLLQNFFDYYSYLFNFPDQERLTLTFQQENIKKLIKESEQKIDSNLETEVIKMEMAIQQTIFHQTQRYLIYFWNLPHSVFPIVVPLLETQSYSSYILKGLCTSTGGISESIIKFSLEELGKYITYIFDGHEYLMDRLFGDILKLMRAHYKDERIIIPLYKTLDYILERAEVITWEGIRKYDTQLFLAIDREIAKTKNILKVSSATGLFVSLLVLNNHEIKKALMESILKILCSDLPKARKVLADKLLMFLMSQEDFQIFSEQNSENLMNILSENEFLDEKLDVEALKDDIKICMGLQ